ncbi:MAG TPA: cysteine dioxygenase family protein [Actinomycetes bacterium]
MLYLHPTLRNADLTLGHDELLRPSLLGPARLGDLADRFAAAGWWRPLVRHDPAERWYTRMLRSDGVEVWLLGWSPGQAVPAHDHGGAAGAFTVVDGELVEETLNPSGSISTLRAGSRTWFGPDQVHGVGN